MMRNAKQRRRSLMVQHCEERAMLAGPRLNVISLDSLGFQVTTESDSVVVVPGRQNSLLIRDTPEITGQRVGVSPDADQRELFYSNAAGGTEISLGFTVAAKTYQVPIQFDVSHSIVRGNVSGSLTAGSLLLKGSAFVANSIGEIDNDRYAPEIVLQNESAGPDVTSDAGGLQRVSQVIVLPIHTPEISEVVPRFPPAFPSVETQARLDIPLIHHSVASGEVQASDQDLLTQIADSVQVEMPELGEPLSESQVDAVLASQVDAVLAKIEAESTLVSDASQIVWLSVSPVMGPEYVSVMRDDIAATLSIDSPVADSIAASIVAGVDGSAMSPAMPSGMARTAQLASYQGPQRRDPRSSYVRADITGCEVTLAFEVGDEVETDLSKGPAQYNSRHVSDPDSQGEKSREGNNAPAVMPEHAVLENEAPSPAEPSIDAGEVVSTSTYAYAPAIVVVAGMVWLKVQSSKENAEEAQAELKRVRYRSEGRQDLR